VVGPMGTRTADIGIVDGRIAAVGRIRPAAGRSDVSAEGCLVLPGGIDGHTHLAWEASRSGDLTADDHYSGTVAAAHGGVTTVVDYARQKVGQSLMQTVDERAAIAGADAVVDFGLHVVPTEHSDATLSEIPQLVREGFPTIKLFLNRVADPWAASVLAAARDAGGLVMLHCDDRTILDDSLATHRESGAASARAWADLRPEASEEVAVRRAISLTRQLGARVCLVHLSTATAVGLVRHAKREGLPVAAETRPAYLLMTRDRYEEPAPRHLMYTGNPPLRGQRSVDALWTALRRGVIDTIASDHAAYTMEQKLRGDRDVDRLPVGMPSLETQLAALYTHGVRAGRVSLRRLVDATATAPARLLGLYPRKGVLAIGSDADLVVFDPDHVRTVRAQETHSLAGHEPLEGATFTGWPIITISRGEIIVRDGALTATRGRGALLRRSGPAPAHWT
jgi:dihydropyrimidinase